MLIFVCALSCEAKPLIDFFSLKLESNETPFKVYRNGDTFLVVTGVGKIASAIGCSYLQGKYNFGKNSIWLNVGVCAGNFPIGTPFLIHKINDHFYPSFTFELPCKTAHLLTVEKPQTKVDSDFLYDMEGAGFFEAVKRFTTLELIHCLKIVSDKGETWLEKETVSKLIEQHIPLITQLKNDVSAHLY